MTLMSTRPRFACSRLSFAVAVLSLSAFVIVLAIPSRSVFLWAARQYARDAELSPRRLALYSETLVRIRYATAAACVASFVAGLLLRAAELKIHDANQRISAIESPVGCHESADGKLFLLIVPFCLVRILIGFFHINDSMFVDELYTVKFYGYGSIGTIFGLNGVQLPNNHVLNSLLLRLSISLGLNSEVGLRCWNFAASVLTIPAAYYLGRRLRLERSGLMALLALVATSPVVDRYGSLARGYGLAILLTTVSLALHLECCCRPSRPKIMMLAMTNILLVLANLFTLPVAGGEVLHLVIAVMVPSSVLRLRGHPLYSLHMLGLMLSVILGIALHTFLLPPLVLGSILYRSHPSLTFSSVLQILSYPLIPNGSLILGGSLMIVLLAYGISRKEGAEKLSSQAIYFVLGSGIGSAILTHVFESRAVAFLHVPTVAVSVLGVRRLCRHGRLSASTTPALLIASCLGAYGSVARPPIQDCRGAIRKAISRAAGRPVWTSGSVAELYEYYAPVLTPKQMPEGSSFYVNLGEFDASDPLLEVVKRTCRLVERIPSETSIAIYECEARAPKND
jgi:hypothetical protein